MKEKKKARESGDKWRTVIDWVAARLGHDEGFMKSNA